MKFKKKHLIKTTLFITLSISLLQIFAVTDMYQSATSYTNAKEFYDSSSNSGKTYHAETINGTIYYATSAKLATSTTSLRYHTLGFDIELYGNGHHVSFSVQRGGSSMVEINSRKDSTHEYILYAINDRILFDLANNANPTAAAYVLNAPVIYVTMNAIVTTKTADGLSGQITENGFGGLSETGTVYHLNNSSHLSTIRSIFSGHTFESYTNIKEELNNPLLNIQYNINGTDTANQNCSSTATVGNGFSIKDGILYQKGSPFFSSSRILKPISLLNPAAIDLSKPGYHLTKEQEWIYDNRCFTSSQYMPKTIIPSVGYSDQSITMYANWQPNTYTVTYDANGGTGSVASSNHTYDKTKRLRSNIFTRTGYHLKPNAEWNTKPDGSGTSYPSKEYVKNLTASNNASVTLYANWEPVIASIHLDKQGGTGGSETLFEKYNTDFFLDADCTLNTDTIIPPSKTGYTFQGYFEQPLGTGEQIIHKAGTLQIDSTHYLDDATIYANYTPNQYTITFDKQGGTFGSDAVIATYDSYFPNASSPTKDGYTFQGYYTQPNGKGTQYYNMHMASDKIYSFAKNITLYAYWKDTTAPTVTLTSDSINWTNQSITLTATATDIGLGLKTLKLYTLDENGTATFITENENCNASIEETLSYKNPSEGIIRYKAIATDMAGNTAEAFHVVYYDTTPPQGETIKVQSGKTNLSFQFYITDVNTKQKAVK